MTVDTVVTVDTVARPPIFFQFTNGCNDSNDTNGCFYPLKNGSNSVCSSSFLGVVGITPFLWWFLWISGGFAFPL